MSAEFWVFGYGSLMWNPGFPYRERSVAELADHRRSFCLDSVRYRGTHEFPGLVLALEPHVGAICRGVAYLVGADHAVETRKYLQDRELDRGSYIETFNPMALADGRRVEALCYIINPENSDYRRSLSLDEKAQIIARAVGPNGRNCEYLFNTLNDLRDMLVEDSEVEQLAERVAILQAKTGIKSAG